MPTKLGRKPLNERLYITGSVGLLTALVLFFVPIYPTTTFVEIPGERRQVNTNDINPGTLAPNQVIEVQTPGRATEFESSRSIFDSIYYQSSIRRVTLQYPLYSWLFVLGVTIATTIVTWIVVMVIYKRLQEPFAD